MTSLPAAPQDLPSLNVPASLGENEAAVLDTFVVPTYLRAYWEAAQKLILVGEAGRVVHLRCMTGFPAAEILQLMPNTTGVGVDESFACLALARSKLASFGFEYLLAPSDATGLDAETFSHALLLHPPGEPSVRTGIFREAHRLLYTGGQAVVSLPLSQSFPEITDLLAEYALKHDVTEISEALEHSSAGRVTVETISEELEEAGFTDIDFEVGETALHFDSGRALLEDPSARYLVIPQIADWLGQEDMSEAMAYVARAVDKYWSDERLDLGVRFAAFSARRSS